MKKIQGIILLGLIILLFTACATPQLRPDVTTGIRSGNVATMYFMEKKVIEYEEMVYKVLWNEIRTQNANFSGMWDIDRDLTEKYSAALVGHGVKSRPVQQIFPDDASYGALVQCVAKTRKTDGTNQPLELSPEVTAKLKSAGIDFLIVIRTLRYYATTTSMMNILSVHMSPSAIIIYDVKGGKEEYNEFFYVGVGNIRYEKSPREIEKNGLEILKKSTYEWLEGSMQKALPQTLLLIGQN